MTETDLFPETTNAVTTFMTFEGKALDKFSMPRVSVSLLMSWNPQNYWVCGWLIVMDRSGDEWTPVAPNEYQKHAYYPWYRTPDMPSGRNQKIVAAAALRMAKIVVEQMIHYMHDEVGRLDARTVSERMETQARQWLTE